jgi:hypothetical protein
MKIIVDSPKQKERNDDDRSGADRNRLNIVVAVEMIVIVVQLKP